ncbi:hypothetical protein [Microbacterium sp. B35-04]|uniref:hypothetical protein n=1 Tax=Microbacterium sp. B35-04 TaxID=1961716 RepID=UPI0013D259BA|nr:hypothetical protein [Microbacterium sp. B35-04]
MTGDDIASALLSCGRALAEAGEAEAVTVPSWEQGAITGVMILIGPASQIVVQDAHIDVEELIDVTAIARLQAIERRLRPVAAVDVDSKDRERWDADSRNQAWDGEM